MSSHDDLTPAEITDYIVQTFPGTDVVTALGATFFSVDPEKHWPNFATIVTTDEHDMGNKSDLAARDMYRLNIGVGRETFLSIAGSRHEYDYTAVDQLMPHPVYAKQRWVCVINPSRKTFAQQIEPLLAEAHAKISRTQTKTR
jgi:Family of unknown function (DUF6194)